MNNIFTSAKCYHHAWCLKYFSSTKSILFILVYFLEILQNLVKFEFLNKNVRAYTKDPIDKYKRALIKEEYDKIRRWLDDQNHAY